MKRFLALLFCLILFTTPAMAQQDSLILTATVESTHTVALKAPASGELAPFTVRAGDAAAKGETLFTVEPVKVYAPIDGTVAAVFAQAGDIAAGVTNRYGAVLYIDYQDPYQAHANFMTGVDGAENRDLRIGQKVYLRSNNEEHFADGVIVALDSQSGSFTVQVIGGDLIFNHTVRIYRTPDYDYNSHLGRASLSAVAPYAVSASGTITDVAVTGGDSVKAGDYLFSYVPDELDPERRGVKNPTDVKAGGSWIVTGVNVQPGASVQKGQTLLTAVEQGRCELTTQAEEDVVGRIHVGDVFTACFEELNIDPVQATVVSVSPLGSTGSDESTYTVRLSFDVPEGVLVGMHATIER